MRRTLTLRRMAHVCIAIAHALDEAADVLETFEERLLTIRTQAVRATGPAHPVPANDDSSLS